MHTQEQLKAKLSENKIDYLVLDNDSVSLTKTTAISVVIIHSEKNLEIESRLINKGVKGVIWYPNEVTIIDDLISTLNQGGFWFDRLTLAKKIKSVNKPVIKTDIKDANKRLFKTLTKREVEIAELVVQGLSNREIAEKTYISQTTVKSHIKNILSKTGAKNRTSFVGMLKV